MPGPLGFPRVLQTDLGGCAPHDGDSLGRNRAAIKKRLMAAAKFSKNMWEDQLRDQTRLLAVLHQAHRVLHLLQPGLPVNDSCLWSVQWKIC